MTDLINTMLQAYAATDLAELEIRFKGVTREVFESLYATLHENSGKGGEFTPGVIEYSINFISGNIVEKKRGDKSDPTVYIRRIVFAETGNTDTYMKKTQLLRPIPIKDYLDYTINLSEERPVSKFSTSMDALIRFKVRISFNYTVREVVWRFDLTAVKRTKFDPTGGALAALKAALFVPEMDAGNFLQKLNFEIVDTYEIEIEHLSGTVAADDLAVAGKVFTLINPQYIVELAYQDEIYYVATHIVENQNIVPLFKQSTHRLKQLSNQVISISKNVYHNEIYPPVGYFLTDKTDGQRAILTLRQGRVRIIMSDGMEEVAVDTDPSIELIADTEYIRSTKSVWVFDVMLAKYPPVADTSDTLSGKPADPFRVRVVLVPPVSDILNRAMAEYTVKPKKFVCLDEKLENGFRAMWEREHEYAVDGLILVEPDKSYAGTRNYKWKPYEKTTIDFLAMLCPRALLGIMPYEVRKTKLYLLFVGISHQMCGTLGLSPIPHYKQLFPAADGGYYPIQFSPSIAPLTYLFYYDGDVDKQIVELSRDSDNREWIFHGVRTDRKMEKGYFGNDFRVAELTYLNYIDPFKFEYLWRPSESYFTKTASSVYMASNKYKRYVISIIMMRNFKGSKWMIDEAAGRGGDLHRYQEIGVENALFIDIDPAAIAELIRRKFAFSTVKKRHIRNWFNEGRGAPRVGGGSRGLSAHGRTHGLSGQTPRDVEYKRLPKNMVVHTLVADLKTSADELMANTFQYGISPGIVNGIVCNFAFHYMCDTLENMRNLLTFNAKALSVGGLFMFTVMDGATVFDLLKQYETGGQWEIRENDVIKYAIRKEYRGDKLSDCGQMISTLLPCSDKMYPEPLCNVKAVIREATGLGFRVELNSAMNAHLSEFAKVDKALSATLTEGDKQYISLYRYVTLRKIREKNSG